MRVESHSWGIHRVGHSAAEASGLALSERDIQTLENGAHLLCVSLLFLEFLVFFIVDDILLHSVLEFILVFRTFHIAIGHDSHDLFVVIKNRESWELSLVVEESLVPINGVLKLSIGISHSRWLLRGKRL